jgi:hypothetical protein
VSEDRQILKTRILPALGALDEAPRAARAGDRPLREGAARRSQRVHGAQRSDRREAHAAARSKVGHLDRVPEIEMPKMPERQLRYFDEHEIARLLAACRASGETRTSRRLSRSRSTPASARRRPSNTRP